MSNMYLVRHECGAPVDKSKCMHELKEPKRRTSAHTGRAAAPVWKGPAGHVLGQPAGSNRVPVLGHLAVGLQYGGHFLLVLLLHQPSTLTKWPMLQAQGHEAAMPLLQC